MWRTPKMMHSPNAPTTINVPPAATATNGSVKWTSAKENATADTSTVNQQVTGTPETPAATTTQSMESSKCRRSQVTTIMAQKRTSSGRHHENGINIPNGFSKKTEINGVNGIQPTAVNSENKILQRVNSEPNKKNGGKWAKWLQCSMGEVSHRKILLRVVSSISDSHSDTLNSAEQEFHETKPQDQSSP
uniref:Uncharacterized protein n=1 Tax=Ditylenchus dipsaci TaxID=166011 RepID=A0A915DNU9_9BILA